MGLQDSATPQVPRFHPDWRKMRPPQAMWLQLQSAFTPIAASHPHGSLENALLFFFIAVL